MRASIYDEPRSGATEHRLGLMDKTKAIPQMEEARETSPETPPDCSAPLPRYRSTRSPRDGANATHRPQRGVRVKTARCST